MLAIKLYTTSHCHLCEQAESMLITIAKHYDISWCTIEIADDNQLLEAYGTKIPVIQVIGTDNEIQWPFDTEDILALNKLDTFSG